MAALDRIVVGATAACDIVIGPDQVAAFADLSNDVNPLHLDASVAREYGFRKPVAHGMLALSAISRLIGTQLPGPGALWLSQEVQFPSPVYVGDRVSARVTVVQLSKSTDVVVLRTEVVNLTTGATVLRGSAKVRVLQRGNRQPASP